MPAAWLHRPEHERRISLLRATWSTLVTPRREWRYLNPKFTTGGTGDRLRRNEVIRCGYSNAVTGIPVTGVVFTCSTLELTCT